jgi:Protein of unknown function (DUF5661)
MNVELEHGLHDPRTNVSDDDAHVTAKNALAHLNEFPDHTRLERMEEEAKPDSEQSQYGCRRPRPSLGIRLCAPPRRTSRSP